MRSFLVSAFFPIVCLAQIHTGGLFSTTGSTIDFSRSAHTSPTIVVANPAALPPTCAVGEMAFVQSQTPPDYDCTAVNTWSQGGNAGAVLLSPSTDQSILGIHLFNVGTPFASLSAEAKIAYGGVAYSGLTNFAFQSDPGTSAILSDRDGTDPSSIGLSAIAVVTNASNNSNQATGVASYSYGTGAGNFGLLASSTGNTRWDGAGTLALSVQYYAARPIANGPIASSEGVHIATMSGANIAASAALHIETQSTASGFYAIFEDGASTNEFGTGIEHGGIFNAATGFRVGGTATAGTFLRGNGTNFVQGNVAYSDITGTPGAGVLLAPSGDQTISGGFKLINSGGFQGLLLAPSGSTSAPGITFSQQTTLGFYRFGANAITLNTGTGDEIQFDSTIGVSLLNTTPLCFSAGAASADDTCIYRLGAASFTLGNTTFQNFSGALKLGTTTLTVAAPTVAAAQVGLGGTVAANTNCGTLALSAGCLVINVAGTTRYVPYY